MMRKYKNVFLGMPLIASFAPMFCCWGPALLSGIAGISGGATYFSWVYPLRPYFFAFAFVSLGYSFFKLYRPQKAAASCPNCEQEKPNFLQAKIYLWGVALFVVFMFTFNYFPNVF